MTRDHSGRKSSTSVYFKTIRVKGIFSKSKNHRYSCWLQVKWLPKQMWLQNRAVLITKQITTGLPVHSTTCQLPGQRVFRQIPDTQQKIIVRGHQQVRKTFQTSDILLQEFPPISQDFEVFTTKYDRQILLCCSYQATAPVTKIQYLVLKRTLTIYL